MLFTSSSVPKIPSGPLVMRRKVSGFLGRIAEPIGWGFTWWGVALYWFAVVLYAVQARLVLARSPRVVMT